MVEVKFKLVLNVLKFPFFMHSYAVCSPEAHCTLVHVKKAHK